MAINKNFVIKNGLEVDESLIYADPLTSKVGIGTTIVNHTLDVLGGIGATDLNVTGISTLFTLNVDSKINVGTAITIDSTTGIITATKFVGDGSSLTGLNAVSEGIDFFQSGSSIGSASTVNFVGAVVTSSGGITTVTVSDQLGDDTNPQLGGNLNLNSKDITGTGNFNVTGIITASALEATNLKITGISTFSLDSASFTELQVGGGTTVTNIDTDLTSVSTDDDTLASAKAIQSYAKLSTQIENIIYVAKDGNDSNSGETIRDAKATIAGAVAVSTKGTTIRVSAGSYVENNPIALPAQVSVVGDSLREVSVSPQYSHQDLFHVANGDYISDMSFTGTLDTGKSVFAFNPNKVGFIDQSPYIQNCTNFIPNSIGLKIDGSDAVGRIKSMVLDSYTQYNQGGIGASITNEGYAQLVSMFTICDEIAVYTGSGGQCDLTNSNSSFGDFGLVSDSVSALKNTGNITTESPADSTEFEIKLNAERVSVSDAAYDEVSGLTTITTYKAHGYEEGMSINLAGLGFTCPPYPHTFSSGVTNAITNTGVANRFTAQTGSTGTSYNPATGLLVLDVNINHGLTAFTSLTATTGTGYVPSTGILTVVTTGAHSMATGDYVKIVEGSLRFTCAKDNNTTNHDYPRATDSINNKWKQVTVTNATTFTINIGKSSDTSLHTWVSAVADGIKKANSLISIVDGGVTFTCTKDSNATNHSYPRSTDPASEKIFGVEAVTTQTITINIGKSSDTSTHTFVSGVTNAVIVRTKAASFTAGSGTIYIGPTGLLTVTSNGHGLTAATTLTAGSGTTYVPLTGLLTVVSNSHGLATGDLVKFDKQSLTFTCTSDGDVAQISYPRSTDPVFNKWKQVTVTDSNTFTVFIGTSTNGNYEHTFISGVTNGIKKAGSLITLTDNSVSFTCTKDNNVSIRSYPSYDDPASCRILGVESVTTNTFTINVGPANLATFPDNYGDVFTVNQVNNTTQFETYVGVSTFIQRYDSGGNTNLYITRPFDGQVVFFDELYYTVSGITITNEGSGYTNSPVITIESPSEEWGVDASAITVFDSENGKVTDATIVSSGRGYTSTPPVINFSMPQSGVNSTTASLDIMPTYYAIKNSTPLSYIGSGTTSGICTITISESVPYVVGVGSTVPFYKQSRIIASSHSFEYVGTGRTIATALPQNGGVLIPENEIDHRNGGIVIYTSTDQTGNFRIGEGVVINQTDGTITGQSYTRSLFSTMTPFILALGGD